MRVLIIGEASFPGSAVKSFVNAFRQTKDIEVIIFDPLIEALNIEIKKYKGDFIDKIVQALNKRINYVLLRNKFNKYILNGKYDNVDLIFDIKSSWLNRNAISFLKERTNAVFFHFNPDSPFDKYNKHPNLINNIPEYDCYFIWNKKLIDKIYDFGAKKVEYLPFAWDPDLHYKIHINEEDKKKYGSDVAFIGNRTDEREMMLEFIADMNLRIWGDPGTGWLKVKKNSNLLKNWTRISVRGEEFSKVCLSSKINLNFLRDQNKGSHNMRTFEVPGCGGFLLTERSEEQCEFFEEDKEIVCFSSKKELRYKIKYYLKKEELRSIISKAAHEKVKKHTYSDRVKKILKIYNNLMK